MDEATLKGALHGEQHPSSDDCLVIDSFRCVLELGTWSVAKLNTLIDTAVRKHETPGARMEFFARALLKTPQFRESVLPALPPNQLRIRLATFDCMTLMWTVVALASASDFRSFVRRYYQLRYHSPELVGIDEDPDSGTIYSLPMEGVWNACHRGFLDEVTANLFGGDAMAARVVTLGPLKRTRAFDPRRRMVRPKASVTPTVVRFLPRARFDHLNNAGFETGDVALLMLGPQNERSMVVDHAVIVITEGGSVNFIHPSRNFSWKPDASTPEVQHSGVFYFNDPRREQLGVSYGGVPLGRDVRVWVNGLECNGQDQSVRRPLADFASSRYEGLIVLRPRFG